MAPRSPIIGLTRGRSLALLAALVGAALAVPGACTQADTIVSVRVRGNITGIQQLQVTLTVGGQMRTLGVPEVPRAISLPTSFTVQLPRSLQGRLQVTVDALDDGAEVIARGNWALPNLAVGQTNQVQIDLTPGAGPNPDGGAPDGGDAGMGVDAEGNGGESGSGGAASGGAPETGGHGAGGGGAGGVDGTGGGPGSGGAATGDAGTGGAGTGGAATGGAGTGGAGTGGAATGGAGTGGAETGGAGTGGAGTGGAGGTDDDAGVD